MPVRRQPNVERARRAMSVLKPMKLWHRYEARGLENIPRTGAALMVFHHSFATYDSFLLGTEVFEETGRFIRGLGDDRLFQTPRLRELALDVGIVPASPTAGTELLAEGELVGVAPGGMWEALRPRSERFQTRWQDRRGFCRLALRSQVPLLFAATPRADEMYEVYDNPITDKIYRRLHLPVPLVRGLGPTVLPRPVKLTSYISELLPVPAHEPEREAEQIGALHRDASRIMNALLRRRD
jgi:1-acyl-sn-glycerol-3-phosphate acyltransferase